MNEELIVRRIKKAKFNASLMRRATMFHINRKIFFVVWITYIYVWQRFERYFSHHWTKWIDLFPLYIGLTRKLALILFGYTVLITIKTLLLFFCYLSQYAHDVVLII